MNNINRDQLLLEVKDKLNQAKYSTQGNLHDFIYNELDNFCATFLEDLSNEELVTASLILDKQIAERKQWDEELFEEDDQEETQVTLTPTQQRLSDLIKEIKKLQDDCDPHSLSILFLDSIDEAVNALTKAMNDED